jgi:anaerobic magnesium-protoporphyrin IX monomethyl ester cyclase
MMSKKVVLIRPRSEFPTGAIPLNLLSIGTAAKQYGYKVQIIDAAIENDFFCRIDREAADALVVGITALTSEAPHALEISDHIKQRFKVPVVWGGWHATLFPEQTCADRSVDFAVINEGENTFTELLRALETGRDFHAIDGLVYKEAGKIKRNRARPFLDMDALPSVDYGILEMSKYVDARGTITYQSSRGCPYQCAFCINVVTGNNKSYRCFSAQRALRDVKEMVRAWGLKYLMLIDDNFFLNKERAVSFCEGLIREKIGIRWFAECRADYFRPGFIDEEFLMLAKKSGLCHLTVGAESGSVAILNKMDKNLTPESIIRSAVYLGKTDIVPGYSFIVGLPGETKADVVATLDLIQRMQKVCPQMEYGIGTLRAYPCSALTEELIAKGYLKRMESLRDWQDDRKRKAYIGIHKQPWHFDAQYLYAVARYSTLAANMYTMKELKRFLLRWWQPHLVVSVLVILSAKVRVRFKLFGFPFDLKIYDSMNNVKEFIKKNLIKQGRR